MTAFDANHSSQNLWSWYLCVVLMISLIFVFIPEAVKAERNQEEFGHLSLDEKWRGDFDGMVERRLVRVLVVLDKIGFFIDKGQYRGVSVELLEAFRDYINRGNKRKPLQVEVLFLEERERLVTAGVLQEDLHFLLGVLERRLAAAREPDAVLEFLHRFLERQVAGLEFLDQFFEVGE